MTPKTFSSAVREVRRFNRFYTRRIGVLQDGLLDSPFSLTEVRVLYELAHRDHPTAGELGRELGLDAGYLSRILARFRRFRLIGRERSSADGRQNFLSLTAKGRREFLPLEARSNRQVAALLYPIASSRQKRLVAAMHVIEDVLAPDENRAAPKSPYILR